MHLRGGACEVPAREGQQHPILRGRGRSLPCSSSHHPTPFLHPPQCLEPLHPTESAPLLTPPGTPGQGLTLPRPHSRLGCLAPQGPRWRSPCSRLHAGPLGAGPCAEQERGRSSEPPSSRSQGTRFETLLHLYTFFRRGGGVF